MKLNLDFYKGTDEYSDGDIEDTILKFIKKYPDNLEKAFLENEEWAIFYHLSSLRKNSISWYPFKSNCTILEVGGGMGAITDTLCKKAKKVTSIELSKRRATAIEMRNEKNNNLEIIVGNFNDIVLKEKYDYILLNGVFEYAQLYVDSEQPYVDFLNKLKDNLKDDGKILIAIENKFGLKYWCGAGEDHTGLPYDGINDYVNSNFARTFSKEELSTIAKHCHLNANFYYMFPDYKFPKIIYTDEALEKNVFLDYSPYYYRKMDLFVNEKNVYKEIYNNKMIPFFANSYFLELSNTVTPKQIEFVKYNNDYRKKEYDIFTYLKDNMVYKEANNSLAKAKIHEILSINKYLKDNSIDVVDVEKDKKKIFSLYVQGQNLEDKINHLYSVGEIDSIMRIYDNIFELIKKAGGKTVNNLKNNIFSKYGIKLNKDEYANLHFLANGVIDIIPSNIIEKDDKYVLFDQEWMEKNVPIEYIMYRGIITTIGKINDKYDLTKLLFKRYDINYELMNELDQRFLSHIHSEEYSVHVHYYNNVEVIDNVNDLLHMRYDYPLLKEDNQVMKDTIKNLKDENDRLLYNFNLVLNSKGWKMLERLRKLKRW